MPVPTHATGSKRLLGFGHSHLSTFLRARRARQQEGRTDGCETHLVRLNREDLQPNFETVDGVRRLTPHLEKRIRQILKRRTPDAVLCVPMGNEYNSMAMVRHPRPYDFAWPERDLAADPSAEEIPFAMMKAQLATLARRNALLFWRAISGSATCPVYLLPPPPPIASEAHILAYPGSFRAIAAKHGINPAKFRHKMWQLYCSVLREAVADSPTHFMELPESVMDGGFLAQPYWSQDPTHANVHYGEILLSAIEEQAFAIRKA